MRRLRYWLANRLDSLAFRVRPRALSMPPPQVGDVLKLSVGPTTYTKTVTSEDNAFGDGQGWVKL